MHRACLEVATGFEECEASMELVLEAGVKMHGPLGNRVKIGKGG
jgi:hypothetical protein